MKNQNGFTLIEVLIASVLIASGLVAMGVFLGNYVNKNGQNKHRTMATVIAEQKIEELRTRALGNVVIPGTPAYINGDLTAAADSSSANVAPNMVTALDADGNVLGATGTAGEVYTLSWVVADTNNPHTVTVTVVWDGIGTSQVVLATLVNDDD